VRHYPCDKKILLDKLALLCKICAGVSLERKVGGRTFLEGAALSKAKFVAVAFSALVVFLFASHSECAEVTPDLARLLAPEPPASVSGSLLERLCFQEGEVIQETHRQVEGERQYTQRRAEREEVPGPAYVMPERPFQFGLRLGALLPAHSRRILVDLGDDPESAGLFGLDLRFPIPPYGWSKLELSFDMNTFGMDIKYNAASYDTIYEDYFDLIFSYIGSFSPRLDIPSPAYWGVGVGWAKEVIRYNPVGGAECFHFTNDSAVFQFKLGWDSGRGVFVEACYKKLLDSERNIDNMWGLVIGFVR
jgi:hypothetical protein